MKLATFEEQAILALLSNQFTSETLSTWSNNLEVIIGFILWMKETSEHSLECCPYDHKPIQQSILDAEVSIQ